MAEAVGIIYVPTGSAELRSQWLQDYRLAAIDTGVEAPPVEPGTDAYLIAEANSQLGLVGLANIAISAKSINVLDATGDDLDAIREADGLPEVPPSIATGKIKVTIAGPTTIPNGTQFKLPNGLRGETVGTVVSPSDGQQIDVRTIDTGSAANLKGGEKVQFVAPPTNVATVAIVSQDFPLQGGTDEENDPRKRARILNTRRNKPAGGNWAYWRQFVLDRYAAIADVYVYPALGGPASQLIVLVRNFDRDNNDYSRAPSDSLVQTIRTAVQSDANSGIETVVVASADQLVDFALEIEIPLSTLSGGNGQGWTNSAPWPTLEAGDSGNAALSATPGDSSIITVDAQTATAPVDGQTEIAWWSSADRQFYTALVVAHSGSAGAWVLTLDHPLVGEDGAVPQSGDYICPNAQNLEAYGNSWVALFESLGPGEMTTDTDRLPRSLRNPNAADEDPYAINAGTLATWKGKHPEVTNYSLVYGPTTTPTVPASVDDPPNVLVPRKFAVYPA